MKIAVDGYEANVSQRLGSSQVAYGVIRHIEKIDYKNEYIIFLPSPPLGDLPKPRAGFSYKILRPKLLWSRIALPLALYTARSKPDLIFSPTHYIPRFSPVKRIVTIFDLSFLHFPEMFNQKDLWQLKNWTKFSAENADHIVTISAFTKKDIISAYGVNKDKITVAYPGYDEEIFHPVSDQAKIKRVLNKYKIKSPFIIYIGTIQPRKNLTRLIETFNRIITQDSNDNLQLLIVGKTTGEGREGWMYQDILNTPQKFGMENRVIFTNYVPTLDLPYLLSGAIAFIQPSLWEGFGIPLLEAMSTGCPVLTSHVSSLPEVVGQAGLLFDPYSTDQMEQALRTVISDQALRRKLTRLGFLQVKKFSWEKMAKTIVKVFQDVKNIDNHS